MQKAEVILSLLSQKARNDENFVFRRLYRNLFNPDFYSYSYRQWCRLQGNSMARDSEKMSGFNTAMVDTIIQKMKSETYYPKSASHVRPNKGIKLPYFESPALEDHLVQEALRLMLEAIYEPGFLDTSHGFRPNRGCHTILYQIKTECKKANWVFQGEIESLFEQINSDILIYLLRKRIDDGRLLELIRRFLHAGLTKCKQGDCDYSGVPQCSGINCLLVNIYLHELDLFMQQTIDMYIDPKQTDSDDFRVCKPKERIQYFRYSDRFIVCVTGPKRIAESLRNQIQSFLKQHLALELNLEKSRISNLAHERVRFLGYDIKKTVCFSGKPQTRQNAKKKSYAETIQLLVPNEVIRKAVNPFCQNGKPVYHNARIHLPLPELIEQYNFEIRRLYRYYCLAADVSAKLNKFRYYHYYSLVKTISKKEKCSVKKILHRYGIDVKRKQGTGTKKLLGVRYRTKNGQEKLVTYFNDPLKKKERPDQTACDDLFNAEFGMDRFRCSNRKSS
ncbi:reverse transcriptase/maturase family protein [Paenactinomyces guangxiensis]|uniref:Reverse transcriptase domain-containing protein n=1 Tax=Paenactinomyces guangxiensis TaxID=1490290 RepID=A0A7W2A8F0_9BACL|nr:reverse transcriptase/maturase family protein [Paenactinomyces guangxiensis]MBA4494104.1 hypothetical protein [Paenactinomyces guangxiensis]MBH8591151.1 group II intron reverse transcriptase domain-containing protein [Paenactinomyces guangxiensis]